MARRPAHGARTDPSRGHRRGDARRPGAAGPGGGRGPAGTGPSAPDVADVAERQASASDLETIVAASAPPAGVAPEPSGDGSGPGRGASAAPGPSGAPRPSAAPDPSAGSEPRSGCTTAQLRRFIKSRPWVPLHELRRRFGIEGGDDEVTSLEVAGARIYVGLPSREGGQLGELIASGEVGYELSHDPTTPIVVGVYPMRPVVRT